VFRPWPDRKTRGADGSSLLRRRPSSPAARSGQQINPPETTLRIVRNFVHKDETIACTPPGTFMPAMEEPPHNIAYEEANRFTTNASKEMV